MVSSPKLGRIYAVTIEPPEQRHLTDRPAGEAILERIVPGARATRYKREWIVGRTEFDNRVLTGRIGFNGEGATAEVWDDEAKDFYDEPTMRGLTTTFAINVDRLEGFVQGRGQVITVGAVMGAIEALLNQGTKDKAQMWHLRSPQRERVTFAQWLETVTKVTKVKIRVAEPNPRWQDAKSIQDVFEQTESQVVSFELNSDNGVNMQAPFLVDSQNHIDRDYGEGRYSGVRQDPDGEHTSTFDTRGGLEELSDELPTQDNGEVQQGDLRARLVQSLSEAETQSDDGPESRTQ